MTPWMRDCDILVTSESKGIALVHEIASRLGHSRYVVCRKEKKPFMLNPIAVNFQPITASAPLELVMDGRYVEYLKGKKVGIVDDIVSTKQTLEAMESLVRMAGGNVVRKAAILVEGSERDDVAHLGVLPIFKRQTPQR